MANPVDTEVSFPEVDTVDLPEETPVKFDEEMLDRLEQAFLDLNENSDPQQYYDAKVQHLPAHDNKKYNLALP